MTSEATDRPATDRPATDRRDPGRPGSARVALAIPAGILLLAVATPAPAKDDPFAARYTELLATSDAASVARAILEAGAGPSAGREIDALGRLLAVSGPRGEAVLDSLRAVRSIDADTLRGELLVWLARGDETPAWKRKQRQRQPETTPTETIGRRGGELLAHDDPIVRALGEWAIAIRLGVECEGRSASPWPAAEDAPWYRRWRAIEGTDALLELDYARQAISIGAHRDAGAIVASARRVTDRIDGLLGWAYGRATAERAQRLERERRRVRKALARLEEAAADRPEDLTGLRRRWITLRRAARRVVLRSPDLDFGEILFATRQGPDSGNITNGGVRDIFGPGGDVFRKSSRSPADEATPLLRGRLGAGHIRGLDLDHDARRIVFSYVRQPAYDRSRDAVRENSEHGRSRTAHLHSMLADGSDLRQLTHAPHNSDVEPCFLPGGDIVFVSDRSNYGSQCAGSFHQDKMILNLFRCSPAGDRVRALSNNKDFDRYPHVLDSGQIIFLHWEYQERHLWQTHTLWTCRPDGSMADAIYKQHIDSGPMSLREARQIPGRQQLVAVACGHHNGEVGAVFLIDHGHGVNEPAAMRSVTPGVSSTEGGYGRARTVSEGGVRDGGGHYQFPYPLSGKSFLAGYSYKKPEERRARNFGLYYIDVWGNKELIHRDLETSVAWVMPLRPRPRPPVLADRSHDAARTTGERELTATAYVANADYGLAGVEPGAVRYIRISQHVPWPCVREEGKACGYNDLHSTPSGAWTRVFGAWTWSPARVIGIVPVEEDGSACFEVPADQPVYFQALDERFLEVRRMRSNVTFRRGESRGCVGCHESRNRSPGSARPSPGLALRRAPSVPEPPPWGSRALPDYERDIQPILDRHCVSCHGEQDAAGGLELTSRRRGDFVQSYRSLFGVGHDDALPVSSSDAWRWLHPDRPMPPVDKAWYRSIEESRLPGQLVSLANRFGGAEVTAPRAFGSSRSRLVRTLIDDPFHREEVRMGRDDWIALVTWVDLNAPYFSAFANKDVTRGGRPAEWVDVLFPDPWERAPAGEWVWRGRDTVALAPIANASSRRLLFLGSSSTYMHNMPARLASWLEAHAGWPGVSAHLVGKSGTGVHVYLRRGFRAQYGLKGEETVLEHIERERYGHVVLQMVTDFIAGEEGDEFDRAVDTYCRTIRAAGGEPVFYEMGWKRDKLNEAGQARVLRAAARNRVRLFAPCSSAWSRVRRERPDIELHNLPDTVHPGTLGHYLNLCCLLLAMNGELPDDLPTRVTAWPGFGSFDKAEADRRLETRKLDPYAAKLPGFMQRMTAMETDVEIDPETAALLRRAALESWREAVRQLTATGVKVEVSRGGTRT